MAGCLVALAVLSTLPAPLAAQVLGPVSYGSVADVTYDTTTVRFVPTVAPGYTSATLTVTGPREGVIKSFEPGQPIVFDLTEIERLQDGLYRWELRIQPPISAETRRTLAAARGTADEESVWWSLWEAGEIPTGPTFDVGAFSVVSGVIIDPGSGREESAEGRANSLATKDIVHPDDVIVRGSLCVGLDCSPGEWLGHDTLRLKEDSVQLHFEDTSGSGFAGRDWRIVLNDPGPGGGDFFAVNDSDAGTDPFLVDGGAGHMALRVTPGGNVGLGTGTPVTKLHLFAGSSPALRLEQGGAMGFPAQTWDLVGNESSFSVRDATNGSSLIEELDQRLRTKDERLRDLEEELTAERAVIAELLGRVALLEGDRGAGSTPDP